MLPRSRTSFLVLTFGVVFSCAPVISAQRCKNPISKRNFFSGIKLGKRQRKSAAGFVELVKSNGVDFSFSSRDSETLRSAGRYLGQKGLVDLETAVKDNRCDDIRASSINQTMTNSPGGIQAGRDVVVNQGDPARAITADQRSAIISVLREHKPAATIYVLRIGDPESRNYANQIAQTIHDAGWQVEVVNFAFQVIGGYGVYYKFSDPEVNQAIMLAFTRAGVVTAGQIDVPNPYPNAILVTLKP